MNDQQRAAMQMALEALEGVGEQTFFQDGWDGVNKLNAAITALREALAQPQGSWVDLTDDEVWNIHSEVLNRTDDGSSTVLALVVAVIAKFKEKNTPPVVPQGEWVDLTDDEKYDLWCEFHNSESKPIKRGYDDCIIAKFKEKNTPPVVPQEVAEGNASEVRSTDTGEPVAWYYKQTHVYLQNAGDVVYIERVVDKPQSWEEHPLYFAPPSVEAAIEATKEKAAKIAEQNESWEAVERVAAAIRSMK